MTFVVDPFGSTTVYTTAPFTLEDGYSDDHVIGFKFHDRQGVEYDLTFCRPETCDERSEPGVAHVLLVANIPALGPVPFPPFENPERFGSDQPATEAEARAFGEKLLLDFKDLLTSLGRPVDDGEGAAA